MFHFTTDLIIVAAFLLITLLLGIRAGRGIKDIKEYALANRTFGTIALFLTYLATIIGGGSVLGDVEEMMSNGLIILIALTGPCIHFAFSARFIAPNMQYFSNCLTTGDVMHSMYGNASKIITGILGSLCAVVTVGIQFIALGKICQATLGIDAQWSIIIGGVILSIYATLGGIKAITVTDVVQFLIVIVVIPILALLALQKAGGIEVVLTNLPATHFKVLEHEYFLHYLSFFLMWGLLSMPLTHPPFMQRALMARNAKQLKNLFVAMSATDLAFRLVLAVIVLAGLALYPNVQGTNMVPHMIRELLPGWFQGVAIAGLLAVVMSTADSWLHAAGLTLVHDVVKPLADKSSRSINELQWAKVSTLVIGIASIFIGLRANNLLHLGLLVVELTAPVLIFPLITGIIGLKTDKRSFHLATIVTFVAFAAAKLLLPPPHQYLTALISITVNGTIFLGSHLWINKGFVTIDRSKEKTKQEE